MPRQYFLYDDKVALRPLEDSDAALLCDWVNDQAVLLYLGIPGRLTDGQELEWIAAMRGSQRDVVLGIVDLSDGALVGTVGIHLINRTDSNAMYGIMLGDKERWSKGIGTAAGMLACDYAFNSLNLHRLHLSVAAFNPRGTKSYEKIGFRHEGSMQQHIYKQGSYHDVLFMGLLRDDFNASHAEWRKQQQARYGMDAGLE
ncbi:MAG: GNAT family N-acetyltransferase [Planctomycetales bacterium]|nr:GNAT family N-acetyltransferase [bacterium]UNM07399.1 MAG: GNAT family N-acetyltransferase [Planctomycetales bacterium]